TSSTTMTLRTCLSPGQLSWLKKKTVQSWHNIWLACCKITTTTSLLCRPCLVRHHEKAWMRKTTKINPQWIHEKSSEAILLRNFFNIIFSNSKIQTNQHNNTGNRTCQDPPANPISCPLIG